MEKKKCAKGNIPNLSLSLDQKQAEGFLAWFPNLISLATDTTLSTLFAESLS